MAKLVFGYVTASVSIVSDGFHSLTDSASNILGLVAVRASRKPPDEDHPYGHRKYQTLAAAGIFVFLLLVVVEVLRTAIGRLRSGHVPEVSIASFVVMLATLAVNLFVVRYEAGAGRRFGSELLLADAAHTRSDVLTSCAVLCSLLGVALGFPALDAVGGMVVAVFIARTGYQIGLETSGILADRVVLSEDDIRRVVMSVPDVVGCHRIRTRGSYRPHVSGPARVASRAYAAIRRAPSVPRGEGSADGELPADRRRDHSHRAAARKRGHSPFCENGHSSKKVSVPFFIQRRASQSLPDIALQPPCASL